MPALKTLTLTVLVLMSLSASPSGADSIRDGLAEPPFELIRETNETNGDIKHDRTVTVDNWSRSSVANHFNSEFTPTLGVPMQWTGNVATCSAGSTSQAYHDATFQMINFYRNMVGLVDVTDAASTTANLQQAALIMSANNALHHAPPDTWSCWTSGGAAAAGSSNLALGNAGPYAMIAYIRDSGTNNYFVGHRRWILYPRRNQFGSGSVGETTRSANAMYVFTSTVSRPPTPEKVAWPPEGYVPYQVVYPRWSFAFNTSSSVSFASADVTMTENGSPISLSVTSRTDNGFGDNTIVWEPSGLYFTGGMQDRRLTVTISNISGPQSTVVYDVVVMDPAAVTDLLFNNGFESGTTGSWSTTAF